MPFGLELAIKLVVIGALIPLTALVLGYAELKISAHMQSRIGPYFAGGRWGWAQLLADGVKFIQKEDIIPDNADRPVFKVAPVLVMISTATLFVILPFGPGGGFIVRDLNLGIFYALAISSLFVRNVYRQIWPDLNETRGVFFARCTIVVVLALGAISAWLMGDFLSIVNIVLTVNLPFGACVLLGYFWRRLTVQGVWSCVILSTLMILVVPWTAAKVPALRHNQFLAQTSLTPSGRKSRCFLRFSPTAPPISLAWATIASSEP